MLLDDILPPMAVQARLLILVAFGGAVYAGWLLLFAKNALIEAIAMRAASRISRRRAVGLSLDQRA